MSVDRRVTLADVKDKVRVDIASVLYGGDIDPSQALGRLQELEVKVPGNFTCTLQNAPGYTLVRESEPVQVLRGTESKTYDGKHDVPATYRIEKAASAGDGQINSILRRLNSDTDLYYDKVEYDEQQMRITLKLLAAYVPCGQRERVASGKEASIKQHYCARTRDLITRYHRAYGCRDKGWTVLGHMSAFAARGDNDDPFLRCALHAQQQRWDCSLPVSSPALGVILLALRLGLPGIDGAGTHISIAQHASMRARDNSDSLNTTLCPPEKLQYRRAPGDLRDISLPMFVEEMAGARVYTTPIDPLFDELAAKKDGMTKEENNFVLHTTPLAAVRGAMSARIAPCGDGAYAAHVLPVPEGMLPPNGEGDDGFPAFPSYYADKKKGQEYNAPRATATDHFRVVSLRMSEEYTRLCATKLQRVLESDKNTSIALASQKVFASFLGTIVVPMLMNMIAEKYGIASTTADDDARQRPTLVIAVSAAAPHAQATVDAKFAGADKTGASVKIDVLSEWTQGAMQLEDWIAACVNPKQQQKDDAAGDDDSVSANCGALSNMVYWHTALAEKAAALEKLTTRRSAMGARGNDDDDDDDCSDDADSDDEPDPAQQLKERMGAIVEGRASFI